MKLLRDISFCLLGVLTLAMIVATVVEKIAGSAKAAELFYHSPLMIAGWILMGVSAMAYVVARRHSMSLSGLMLHISFALILGGAGVTYLWGEKGKVTLQEGSPAVAKWTLDGGEEASLPFRMRLKECGVEYYPGTMAPMDYYSDLEVSDAGDMLTERVSMNNVMVCQGYRFYQTAMGDGYTVLSVSHDPWGIGISYGGYCAMFVSMLAFFFAKHTRFRRLLKAVGVVMLICCSGGVAHAGGGESSSMPRVLQRPLAKNFGRIYVYWGDRVVPLQTTARDFCMKVYGKSSYKGFSPEQVFTGWIFYYDDWKREPMIKIKGDEVKSRLGTDGAYVSLTDFYDRTGYKLHTGMEENLTDRNLLAADEKVNLISLVCTGRGVKIFPSVDVAGEGVEWYSWVDDMPAVTADNPAGMMEAIAKDIAHGRFVSANTGIDRIKQWQVGNAGEDNLPGRMRFEAELLYNSLPTSLPAAVVSILSGFFGLVLFCRGVHSRRSDGGDVLGQRLIVVITAVLLIYITCVIILRGVVGGHLPLSNGFETMQCLAWIGLVLAMALRNRLPIVLPGGLLVCGFALMVAMMGESNPAVGNLMPVLASPLLSLHVMLIMTSYALFAVMMINSACALMVRRNRMAVSRLADISEMLLYPAVFLLGAGIFVGAIWANQSWGRYWGWDPKETWALVTLIIYAWPIHAVSFPWFRRPGVRNAYFAIAFLAVLMTYFGVNYLLSGLHSYA